MTKVTDVISAAQGVLLHVYVHLVSSESEQRKRDSLSLLGSVFTYYIFVLQFLLFSQQNSYFRSKLPTLQEEFRVCYVSEDLSSLQDQFRFR